MKHDGQKVGSGYSLDVELMASKIPLKSLKMVWTTTNFNYNHSVGVVA